MATIKSSNLQVIKTKKICTHERVGNVGQETECKDLINISTKQTPLRYFYVGISMSFAKRRDILVQN